MVTLNTAALSQAWGSDPTATATATPTIIIYGEMGMYRAWIDGADLGTFQPSDPFGRHNVIITVPLADGPHVFSFEELSPNPGGPAGFPCQPFSFSVDTRLPTAPVITSVVPRPMDSNGRYTFDIKGTVTAGENVRNVRFFRGPSGMSGAVPTGTTFQGPTFPTLPPGEYDFTAAAYDQAGNVSARSAPYHVRAGVVLPPPQPKPPAAVGSVIGTVSAVNLSWVAPSSESSIIEYRIYRDGILFGSTSITNFTDTRPTKGAAYSVSAINAAGEGPQSVPIVFWT